MSKYVIIIGSNNKEVSRKVQGKLFEYGFKWLSGTKRCQYCNKPYLCLNYHKNGKITYTDNDKLVADSIMAKDAIALTPESVLEYCHLLEGAKKQVKKMTLAEVCKELGYEVEIVK